MSDAALFEFLLRQGDNTLILGHRVSEWCGLAPALEEDIALANTALDLIGQAQMWLGLAVEVEAAGRTTNDLAYRRDVWDFRNLLLVEQPNGDFAQTILRQFFFDAFQVVSLRALEQSSETRVAEIAAKSLKEALYHLERSQGLVLALGDGTEESNARMQASLDLLWPYAGEMFADDRVDDDLSKRSIAPRPSTLRAGWEEAVLATLDSAFLRLPASDFAHAGGRSGKRHSEHLGHLLATMQFLPRAYPDARW